MKVAILIVLFILPLSVVSQVNQFDSSGERHGLWEKQYPNGKMMYKGHFEHGTPVGEWKRYHGGGQIKAIIYYSEKSDSAFTQLYSKQGEKIAEGNYINQQKAGRWTYFSGEEVIVEEHFSGGQKHGLSRKYYDSGELLETTEWKHGKREGDYEVFYKNGKPFMQCKFSNDQRNGLCLSYFENERIEMKAYYKNSLRHGHWKFYNQDGDHLYTLKYDEGEILNPEVRDSIDNLQMQNLEEGRQKILDPEKFLQDPSEYMRKMNVYR